jgi:TRAP-type C4-dicarboxylate transport system substrate-binding protein
MDRLKTDADARAKGIEVVTLTAEERQAFREKVTPVYESWKEKVGAELVDMILDATK